MSTKKLTKQLVETMQKLNELITALEEANVNVAFFHNRGEFGRFTQNKSDRISLACVLECHTLYDSKSNTINIEESTDDTTAKA